MVSSLTDFVRQGSYVSASNLNDETKSALIHQYHIPLENKANSFRQPARLVLVVFSQDCDIDKPATLENCIELVLAKKSTSAPNTIQFTKSAQKLPIKIGEDQYELNINKRFFVPKSEFKALFNIGDDSWNRVGRPALDMMRDWMSIRYERHPFPTRFDLAFKSVISSSEQELRILSSKIQAIAVFLDEQVEEMPEYHCHLKIVTYPDVSPDDQKEISEFLKKFVADLSSIQTHPRNDTEAAYIHFHIEETEDVPGKLAELVLTSWHPVVRPESFTLEDYRNCQFYNVNYLCYDE